MIRDNIGIAGCGSSAMPVRLDPDPGSTGIVVACPNKDCHRGCTTQHDNLAVIARGLVDELANMRRTNSIEHMFHAVGRVKTLEAKPLRGNAYKVHQATKWANKYSSKRI